VIDTLNFGRIRRLLPTPILQGEGFIFYDMASSASPEVVLKRFGWKSKSLKQTLKNAKVVEALFEMFEEAKPGSTSEKGLEEDLTSFGSLLLNVVTTWPESGSENNKKLIVAHIANGNLDSSLRVKEVRTSMQMMRFI